MKERILSLGKFLKRNVYYVLLVACILAVGTMITLTIVNNSNPNDLVIEAPDDTTVTPKPDETPVGPEENEPNTDVVVTPVIFCEPVVGEVVSEYAVNELIYCSTLKQWQTHSGMDYACETGATVVAVYDGTVYSVTYDLLNGNTVTVDHGNGLMTKYSSLDSVSVVEGAKLKKGDTLGIAGNTAMSEVNLGTHLHFETLLDNVSVNPLQYSDNK